LRGLDLNQRPSGYENDISSLGAHNARRYGVYAVSESARSQPIVHDGAIEMDDSSERTIGDLLPGDVAAQGALWSALGDALEHGDLTEARALWRLLERRSRGGA
jgi:hypothetical protein